MPIINEINVPANIACLPDFSVEIDFMESWASSIFEGAIAQVKFVEALALPEQPTTLLPIDASPEAWAAILKAYRRFFELPEREPDAVRMLRMKMEKVARKLAKHQLKNRVIQ